MHDLRFYHSIRKVSVSELASLIGGQVVGPGDEEIITVAPAQSSTVGALSFFMGNAAQAADVSDAAAACITTEKLQGVLPETLTKIVVGNPQKAFAQAANTILALRTHDNPGKNLGESRISEHARIGPNAVISAGVEIGDGSVLGANCVIGPGVRIGRGCVIGSGVVIDAALIGNNVRIKSNSVLGGDGFGMLASEEGLAPMPHFGRVIIQDGVGLGSNVCVDRGAFEDTVIGENTQVDNLSHIGHNVQIGRNSLIAAFGGISGSVKIGDWVQMGGRVGVSDHVTVGSHARLAADSAVMRDVPEGETWGGAPARPIQTWKREVVWVSRNAARKKSKEKD